ncbi:MAG: outer membrane beta-barrel protein [Rikenellaceae bacterium]
MSRFDNSFEESIRRSLEGIEVAPPDQLWGRVEGSLDGAAATAPSTFARVIVWSSALAAALLLAVGVNLLLTDQQAFDDQMLYAMAEIRQFESVDGAPMALKPVVIRDVEPRFEADVPVPPSVEQPVAVVDEVDEVASDGGETRAAEEQKDAGNSFGNGVSNVGVDASDQSSRDLYLEQHSKAKSPIDISLMLAGGSASTSSTKAEISRSVYKLCSTYDGVTLLNLDSYAPIEAKHYMPISFALSFAYHLGERWSLESGVNYSRLISDLMMPYSRRTSRQDLQFVGMPLRVNYKIYNSKSLALYSGAGPQVERCIVSKLDSKSISEKPWHLSVAGVVGLQYNITNWFGLYAEPEVHYYLTTTELSTIRNDSPLSLNVRFGLRFMLGGE